MNLHKIINILLGIIILGLLVSFIAFADGYSPAVNLKMGCTLGSVQPLMWDGVANINCQNFPQPDWTEANTSSNDYIRNKPSLPAGQINSDWNASSGLAQILNKPTIAVNQAFEGTTQRLNAIIINKSAAATGGTGTVVYNITADGTSGGTALCPNGVMTNSPNLSVNDATAPYQFSWAWSNSNKTVTATAYKASGLAVLTFTLLGIPAPVPNGTSVNITLVCY